MRPVVTATGGEPLLAVGRIDGDPIGLITFELGESDLPLQVAFPLLMSNLVDFMLPPVDGVLPPSTALGEPIALAVDPSLAEVALVDAGVETRIELVGGRGTLPGAERVGIRELRDASGTSLGRVAANLFDAAESAVDPGDPQRLIEMGRTAAAGAEAQPSRAEWWWPLALLGLLLLLVEWVLFHRPTRRSVARALGHPTAASGPTAAAGPGRAR
jgi:Ca-activated chloride channel family protein